MVQERDDGGTAERGVEEGVGNERDTCLLQLHNYSTSWWSEGHELYINGPTVLFSSAQSNKPAVTEMPTEAI